MIEKISAQIATNITDYRELERIQYLKMKLGLETLLINLSKGVIVYGVAVISGIFTLTLITHLTYSILRRSSGGLHAKSSFVCTMVSITMFVVIPYFLQRVAIPFSLLMLFFVFCMICISKYAPADTENHPLIGVERREQLRRRSIKTCFVLMTIAVIIPFHMIRTLIVAGIVMQIVMILPITYKMLKRSCNNYEKYEV